MEERVIKLLPELEAGFLKRDHGLFIGGQWQAAAAERRIEVVNPATGRVIATTADAGASDVDRAVAAARAAFDNGPWGKMSGQERSKLLWALAALIDRDADELGLIETLNNGKPLRDSRGIDIPGAANLLRYMAGWSTKNHGDHIELARPGNWHSYTIREPVGVVGQIIPWNYPLSMAMWKLAPALAAGCTIVLKPAEQTPLSVLRLAELIAEAGIPAGVVNVVTGFGETAGAAIVAHRGIDKIAFTGSTQVGRRIVQACASDLKRVSLELGGKSPIIVFPDISREMAIQGAAGAIFGNAGQNCTAGSRLFVHERIYDEVAEGLAAHADTIRVGSGLDPQTQMGPLVSREHFDRVSRFVENGRQSGAKLIAGGSRVGEEGFFMRPTVFAEVPRDASIYREEIFGPVLCMSRFSDDDLDAIAADANDTEFGLGASIWTRDLGIAHKLARRVRAGTVWVNSHNVGDPALPFGGFGASGWGREKGREGYEMYTELKTVMMNLG